MIDQYSCAIREIVFVNPAIRVSIMIPKQFYPKMVSYCAMYGCRYISEEAVSANGNDYAVLKDISGSGMAMGCLIQNFYDLKYSVVDDRKDHKFYISFEVRRKKGKKNVQQNRTKPGEGSESGNNGKPTADTGSGPVGGSAGDGTDIRDAGIDGARRTEGEAAGDRDCE